MERKKKMKSSHVEIPSDIISEIFSWLPVKSLMRFKCVSRFYNALVSDDESFIDTHQSRSVYRHDMTKFLAHSRRSFYTIDLKVKHRKASALRIDKLDGINYDGFAYVNGLFCLWSKDSEQPPVIYNPTTRNVKSLPCLNIVVKQSTSPHYSIGFEADEKKYKILMTTQSQNILTRHWIFTLGSSKSWREIKIATHPLLPFLSFNGGFCLDGVIYFFCNYQNKTCIMAFNVRTENSRIISLWKNIQFESTKFYNLIKVEGKLAGIDHSRWYARVMDLWILERSEEWVKHSTIAIPLVLSPSFGYSVSCSYINTPHDDVVLMANSPFKSSWMLLYDLKKKSWKSEIQITELEKKEIFGIYSYVDCLSSCIYY